MMNKMRYAVSAVLVSAACLMWLLSPKTPALWVTGNILLFSGLFIVDPGQLRKPIHLAFPKWNSEAFLNALTNFLIIGLVVLLILESPDNGRILMGKWYFTGIVWLICVGSLARNYVRERKTPINSIQEKTPNQAL